MWRLVAIASLAVSVQGLGDIFPYVVTNNKMTYADQTSSPWTLGQCASGTKQSPINIKTLFPMAPLKDPGVVALSGFDQETVYGVHTSPTEVVLGYQPKTTVVTALDAAFKAPMFSGGPLVGR